MGRGGGGGGRERPGRGLQHREGELGQDAVDEHRRQRALGHQHLRLAAVNGHGYLALVDGHHDALAQGQAALAQGQRADAGSLHVMERLQRELLGEQRRGGHRHRRGHEADRLRHTLRGRRH